LHRIDGRVLNSIRRKRFPALSREVTQGGNGAQGTAEARMQISKKTSGKEPHFLVVEVVSVFPCRRKDEGRGSRIQQGRVDGFWKRPDWWGSPSTFSRLPPTWCKKNKQHRGSATDSERYADAFQAPLITGISQEQTTKPRTKLLRWRLRTSMMKS
jgi:hypothetical protein